jgi:hypothetical protein
VLEQLRTSRIDRIKDPHAAKVEHENIWNCIDVSVNFLSADEQARFLELAVFPPDEATPIAALGTLWSHTAGFDDWDTDALVIKLSQRSLLELTTSAIPNQPALHVRAQRRAVPQPLAGKAISLHDLVYDYLRRAARDEIALHQRLLEAYRRKCPGGWHVDPPNDGYFFTHLRHHLIAAGRASELADLLHELRWLEAKNEAGIIFDLIADLRSAIIALTGHQPLVELLDRPYSDLRSSIIALTGHGTLCEVATFLAGWGIDQRNKLFALEVTTLALNFWPNDGRLRAFDDCVCL